MKFITGLDRMDLWPPENFAIWAGIKVWQAWCPGARSVKRVDRTAVRKTLNVMDPATLAQWTWVVTRLVGPEETIIVLQELATVLRSAKKGKAPCLLKVTEGEPHSAPPQHMPDPKAAPNEPARGRTRSRERASNSGLRRQ